MARPESINQDVSTPENRELEQQIAKLSDSLRRYSPAQEHRDINILEERYQIDLASELTQFASHTARAFAAIDLLDPKRQLFAQICEPGTLQRHRAIIYLKATEHPSILQLVASGPVILSPLDQERFVLIYQRPSGMTLAEALLQHKIQLTQEFICENIIAPLAAGIQQFAELDITHGTINPENIYFDGRAILGPCVSEPCGYSQPFYFESIERIQALPYAKGEGTTAQDYYALGIAILYLLFGPGHFANYKPEKFTRSLIREGAYNVLVGDKVVPEKFYDFFRGLLTQGTDDRWNFRYIKPWLEGKHFHVLPPPPPTEALRPFDFGEPHVNTRRELAHLYASDWERMIVSVQNNHLAHWISISLRNKERAEVIARLSKSVTELHSKNEAQTHEQLMNIVMLLDPIGPMRIKQLAAHVDGMDSLCVELHVLKAPQDLQILAKFIEFNMGNYWLELQDKAHSEYTTPTSISSINVKFDQMRSYIRNTGLGFGFERLLYDLNPDMPCISPLLTDRYITNLTDLLTHMDRVASHLPIEEPLDRHIAAFVASKLGLQHEVRLDELTAIPAMANSRSILALYLLAAAHQKSGKPKLPGLTHWLAIQILPLLETVHSRTLKQKLKHVLLGIAPSGDLTLMSKVVIMSDYVRADNSGFGKAYIKYQRNEAEIQSYRRGTRVEKESARVGFLIAKALAYTALALTIVNYVQGNI